MVAVLARNADFCTVLHDMAEVLFPSNGSFSCYGITPRAPTTGNIHRL